jgi:hypothetical protein
MWMFKSRHSSRDIAAEMHIAFEVAISLRHPSTLPVAQAYFVHGANASTQMVSFDK